MNRISIMILSLLVATAAGKQNTSMLRGGKAANTKTSNDNHHRNLFRFSFPTPSLPSFPLPAPETPAPTPAPTPEFVVTILQPADDVDDNNN